MKFAEIKKSAAHFRKSQKYTYVSWALVVVWAALIFCMSSNSGSDLDSELGLISSIFQALKDIQVQLLGEGVDLISSMAHFCEYAVFGALWVNALSCHMPLSRAIGLAIACSSLYGASDEFHQLFVPERMCDPMDWVVDTLGAAVGTGLASRFIRRYPR